MDNTDEISDIPKRRKKVYYAHRQSTSPLMSVRNKVKPYPVIHLGGKYLSESDFNIGDSIDITMDIGKIVITKATLKEDKITFGAWMAKITKAPLSE